MFDVWGSFEIKSFQLLFNYSWTVYHLLHLHVFSMKVHTLSSVAYLFRTTTGYSSSTSSSYALHPQSLEHLIFRLYVYYRRLRERCSLTQFLVLIHNDHCPIGTSIIGIDTGIISQYNTCFICTFMIVKRFCW